MRTTGISLPPELLMIIFEACVSNAHAHDGLTWQFHICKRRCLSWVRVTRVCRQWRSVALEHPRLWSAIVMTPGRRDERLTEAMIARSAGTRLSLSMGSNITGDEGKLVQRLSHAKEVVLRAYPKSLVSLLGELETQRDPPRDDIALESLSLTRFRGLPDWSDNNHPVAGCRIFNGNKLRRLHLNSFALGRHLPGFLKGMVNLQELSLSSTIRSRIDSGPIRPKVDLPRLSRLHMEEPIHSCKAFVDSLDLSEPLEYMGLDSRNGRRDPSAFFADVLGMLNHHCLMNTSADSSSAIPEPSQWCSALSIRSLTRRGCTKNQYWFKTNLSFVVWPVNLAPSVSKAFDIVKGTNSSWDHPEIKPTALSAVLASNPAIFIRSIFETTLNVVSSAFSCCSLVLPQSVVCAVIDDIPHEDVNKDRVTNILSEMPFLRSLEIGGGSLLDVIAALHPANNATEAALAPRLRQLVLSSNKRADGWFGPLVLCLSARKEIGHPLQQLSFRGQVRITVDELQVLQGIPVAVTWNDSSDA
ncbi:hypothetical protein CONPUDRAFT_77240 [Coniophora puteana RWD-64-598 SS2]|uniref:Uncharacterized protein n=1 Tax=Coniophora puteana (strain RWD-64-598) TaxID=741705 RepID=A0A5M3MAD0_CONPW|nr:uncharacterized protein CONPUDRAFT_77240 [Coniophora puteana RWD-64-598 SS2]EIW75585.1 hypothetical protein CONPUDRAFT_77240 [Coniophora puteana RWD-64-598 SS2]